MSKSFGRGAVALAVISIISKLLGALYRVPLTNILGAEGMGLYQTVFPVFTVLLMICGGGMTGAVSRTVAKYYARGKNAEVKDIFFAASVPLFVFSVVAATAVMLLRRIISELQGVPSASIAYLALTPSLIFCSIISVFRGVFQGRSMMMPSGISQLIEQTVKLSLGLLLGKLMLPRGVEYAVMGALLGVTVSEVVAFIYLLVRYIVYNKSRGDYHSEGEDKTPRRELIKEIMRFSLPVTLGMLIIPMTQVFDSSVVVNMLVRGGMERGRATALFGVFVGPVGTLINMPVVLLSALSAALLPSLTAHIERGERELIKSVGETALTYTLIIALPVAAAFMFFPKQICALLYGAGLSAEEIDISSRLLSIEAVSVIYVGVISYTTAVMQSHGRATKPAVNLLIGGAVKIALTFLLIPRLGIYGAAVASVSCYAVAALLGAVNVYRLKDSVSISPGITVRPLVFTAFACAVFYAVSGLLGGGRLSTLIAGAASVIVYLLIVPSMKIKGGAFLPSLLGKQKRLKK
ncbi:MAG: polysaccharide biosynthesis protein [Clostridiales bacterium]|nr:polysaccharide biosynthesis protein [Clostridiales bacterium]